MNKKVDEILAELLEFDPSLAEFEKELRAVIAKMLQAKPQEITPEFEKKLKREVMAYVSSLKQKEEVNLHFNKGLMFNKFLYVLSGALVVVLVFVAGFYNQFVGEDNASQNVLRVKLGEVQNVASNAFGDFNSEGGGAATETQAIGLGGAPVADVSSARSFAADEKMLSSSMSYYPDEQVLYEYDYKGESVSLSGTTDVLKRIPVKFTASVLNEVIPEGFRVLFTYNALENAEIDSLSFSEEKELGYTVYYDFRNGSLSVNQNGKGWYPTEYKEMTKEETLADEEVLKIANAFIKKYGVNLDNYAEPVVDNEWRISVLAQEKAGGYVYYPEQVSVVYPTLINGKKVYSEWGEVVGLSVNVNQRLKLVSNMNLQVPSNFEASSYDSIGDFEKILEIAKKGGVYPDYRPFPADKATKKTVELAQAEEVYMQKFYWDGGVNETYYVPALKFDVANKEALEGYYKKQVIVPVVKDLLATYQLYY
jgi:hypothetical protein